MNVCQVGIGPKGRRTALLWQLARADLGVVCALKMYRSTCIFGVPRTVDKLLLASKVKEVVPVILRGVAFLFLLHLDPPLDVLNDERNARLAVRTLTGVTCFLSTAVGLAAILVRCGAWIAARVRGDLLLLMEMAFVPSPAVPPGRGQLAVLGRFVVQATWWVWWALSSWLLYQLSSSGNIELLLATSVVALVLLLVEVATRWGQEAALRIAVCTLEERCEWESKALGSINSGEQYWYLTERYGNKVAQQIAEHLRDVEQEMRELVFALQGGK